MLKPTSVASFFSSGLESAKACCSFGMSTVTPFISGACGVLSDLLQPALTRTATVRNAERRLMVLMFGAIARLGRGLFNSGRGILCQPKEIGFVERRAHGSAKVLAGQNDRAAFPFVEFGMAVAERKAATVVMGA